MGQLKFIVIGLISAVFCSLLIMSEKMVIFAGPIFGLSLFIAVSTFQKSTIRQVSNLIFTLMLTGAGWFFALIVYVYSTFQFIEMFDHLETDLGFWPIAITSGFIAGIIGGISVWLSYCLIKSGAKLRSYHSIIWVAGLAGSISSLFIMQVQSPFLPTESLSLGLSSFMPWQIIVFYWLSCFEPASASP